MWPNGVYINISPPTSCPLKLNQIVVIVVVTVLVVVLEALVEMWLLLLLWVVLLWVSITLVRGWGILLQIGGTAPRKKVVAVINVGKNNFWNLSFFFSFCAFLLWTFVNILQKGSAEFCVGILGFPIRKYFFCNKSKVLIEQNQKPGYATANTANEQQSAAATNQAMLHTTKRSSKNLAIVARR